MQEGSIEAMALTESVEQRVPILGVFGVSADIEGVLGKDPA